MTPVQSNCTLARDLRRILESTTVSTKYREAARSLLHRFEAPIAVWVMGPDGKLNELVFKGLSALSQEGAVHLALCPTPLALQPDDFERIDIAIWCSIAFGSDEEQVWANAPDDLKDRSVLVRLADSPAQVAPCPVTELFDEVVTLRVSESSDILGHLSQKLLERVQAGVRADADNAAFLIESCNLPEVEASAFQETVETSAGDTASSLEQVKEMMRNHAESLQGSALEGEELATHILSSSEDLMQRIAEILEQEPAGVISETLVDEVLDAQDGIVLMALEGGVNAAEDAMATLIQLRKDLHLESAA